MYPVNTGPHRPMTDEESKVMLGVFIVLNIIWLLNTLRILWINRPIKSFSNFYEYFDFLEAPISVMLNAIMIVIWVIIILVGLGSIIANFL